MKNKVAIVTGGNTGLGYATASKLCEEGATTYIIGRNREKTENACSTLGKNAIPIVFDINNQKAIPGVVENIVKESSRIDILVNNAGINMKKEFLEVTDEDFLNIIQTNVLSLFTMSRETVKVMKKQRSGNIVNISSMAAQYGIPKVIAYAASKTAVEGMTRAMATELAAFGIRVNCVAPGFIKTAMSSTALDNEPERKQKVLSRTPMQKLGDPKDIASAVYYLASEEAKFVTGVVMPVDGGNSIGF